jgi:hypothetical protein
MTSAFAAAMLGPRTGRPYAALTSIEDWNREFSELVRRGAGEPGGVASAEGEPAVGDDVPVSDADCDEAVAGRRVSIAASLVRLRFIAADRTTPENPAIQVLSELVPPDAVLGMCLTCHEVLCQRPVSVWRDYGRLP